MIATIASASLLGVDGHPVSVEVHIARGLPAFTVVGLPDAACRESRDRVRAAFSSSLLEFPKTRVTVNLAPSGVRKVGSGLDLPIALGILAAQGRVDGRWITGTGFVGELGLDGTIRSVPGLLSLVDAAGSGTVVVPAAGIVEASLVPRVRVLGATTLRQVVACLEGREEWPAPCRGARCHGRPPGPELADVRGQPLARWALEVAAAGGHHLLMIGPPGAGKTMLASRLPGLLPALDHDEALAVTRIHSAGSLGLPDGGLVDRPPFRAPHHTASMVSLIGGGTSWVRPGEISFAHHGVLFLDELGEFPATVLETLRQPLEEGVVRIARARQAVTLPARFQLVAATNPCPCGEGNEFDACLCSEGARTRYQRRLSGPLLDRLDLRVVVGRPGPADLLGTAGGETTAAVAERVMRARELAAARGVRCNAELGGAALDRWAALSPAAARLVEYKLRNGRLSARGLHRLRRVARTLADLAGESGPSVGERHVAGALELRADLGIGVGAA